MTYPDTAPADLSALSLWPDPSATMEGEMAAWAQTAGYTQPGLDVEGIPLDILDATLAWGQSGKNPTETSAFQTDFATNWTRTSRCGVAEANSCQSIPFLDATAIDKTTTVPDTMPPIFTNNTGVYAEEFFFTQPDVPLSLPLSSTPCKSPAPCLFVRTHPVQSSH
ncbi:hypothetical protein EI94DRAFT_601817 [Lactarius quietus]|nr:hypothetical protein EI94DRAFT_601817 [Lactarius quietus]